MKCTKCDKEIENGAKFCTFCGAVQEEIKEEKPTDAPVITVVPKAAKKPEKKAKKEAKAPKNATLPEQKAKDKPKKEKAPKKDIPKGKEPKEKAPKWCFFALLERRITFLTFILSSCEKRVELQQTMNI